jgi:nucleoside-diphosphate-sugar epimerase
MEVAGKSLKITSVPGPIGVWSRNFSNARIKALGWRPRTDLRAGIARTYPWILEQVRRADRPPG